jgi:tyrosyl-tRNA synthetase
MKFLDLESEIFVRGVEDIVTKDELSSLLKSGKKLRIKHGIDATSPDLHVGHAANLWKIRELQEAGHKAVILLGDVTTQIGDPTGKAKTRPALSPAEISQNIKSIESQLKKILMIAPSVFELRRSSEWYNKLPTPAFLKLLSMITHARLVERDMFQKRIKEGGEIRENEVVYPILQGYDSVMLKADLTVIGSDQLFNEHMGRHFQEKFEQKPQVIVTLKILPGLDGGAKMSKSLGNYISLLDSPRDKFGKAMTLPDDLIVPYLETYTDTAKAEISEWGKAMDEGKNPMEAKLFFAEALVRRYHGSTTARKEREQFLELFSKKDISNIPSISFEPGEYHILDLLQKLKLAPSRSEARRLVEQKAVEINGTPVTTIGTVTISKGTVIRVGKRRFAKIK